MRCLVAAALALLSIATAAAAVPSISQRYALGQPGGWDYLSYDAAGHRLFVTRSDRVMVIDADSGHVTGEIPHTDGVHGVALVPELGKGFTSNGRANTVTVFDLATLKPGRNIPVKGENPDAILFDPASRHLFVFNGRSNSVSVIDPAGEALIATIPLSSKPEYAASDGEGRVYVNLEGSGQLAAIDSMRNTVIATWSLGDCEEPTGLAFDAADHLSFSTCQNRKMVVFDVMHGRIVTALGIGGGPDGAAFDPLHRRVYAANGEGSLSVYHVDTPNRFSLLAELPTQKSARTLALDSAGQRVFLAAAQFGPALLPSAETPRPRPPMLPGSFTILVVH